MRSLLTPKLRWYAPPLVIGVMCTVISVAHLVLGEWLGAVLLWALAAVIVINRQTQRHAFKSGYYRAKYDPDHVNAPEPWDPDPVGDQLQAEIERGWVPGRQG